MAVVHTLPATIYFFVKIAVFELLHFYETSYFCSTQYGVFMAPVFFVSKFQIF